MDVETFVLHPFHSQENDEFFCHEPPFAYFPVLLNLTIAFLLVYYYS